MAASDPRKTTAAKVFANGGTQAKAAQAAGVARSSVLRWLKTEEFRLLIDEQRGIENPETLESLIPLAHAQLKASLEGMGHVTAGQAKLALDVLKAAAALEKNSQVSGASSLAARLETLEERGRSD